MEKDTCYELIKETIRNRSCNCNKLSSSELFSNYKLSENNEKATPCSKAINKYKKRIIECGAKKSFREQRFDNKLKQIYYINSIFKK